MTTLSMYSTSAYQQIEPYRSAHADERVSVTPSWRSCAMVVLGAACIFLGSAGGTGGNVSVRGAISPAQSGPALAAGVARGDREREEETDHPQALAVGEQLGRIKSGLKLTTSDLATLLGVSRPTIYNWAKGVEPSADALVFLQFLAAESEKISALGLARPNALLKRPIFDGQSALDILQSRITLSPSHLKALAVLDEKELTSRNRAKGLGPMRSHVEAIEEQGNSYGWDSTN